MHIHRNSSHRRLFCSIPNSDPSSLDHRLRLLGSQETRFGESGGLFDGVVDLRAVAIFDDFRITASLRERSPGRLYTRFHGSQTTRKDRNSWRKEFPRKNAKLRIPSLHPPTLYTPLSSRKLAEKARQLSPSTPPAVVRSNEFSLVLRIYGKLTRFSPSSR